MGPLGRMNHRSALDVPRGIPCGRASFMSEFGVAYRYLCVAQALPNRRATGAPDRPKSPTRPASTTKGPTVPNPLKPTRWSLRCLVLTLAVSVTATSSATAAVTTRPASAADQRRKAVLAVYEANRQLQYRYLTNKTNTPLVLTQGPKIYTGAALQAAIKDEASILASGIYYDMRLEQYEALNLRIESISTTTAVIRVCERTTPVAKYKRDDSPAPDDLPVYVSDKEITVVYSARAKRWLISKQFRLEADEGRSRCGDSKP